MPLKRSGRGTSRPRYSTWTKSSRALRARTPRLEVFDQGAVRRIIATTLDNIKPFARGAPQNVVTWEPD